MNTESQRQRAAAKLMAAAKHAEEVLRHVETGKRAEVDQLTAAATRLQRTGAALLLAAAWDEPVPLVIFKAWASYGMFRRWELAGKIQLERLNGKVCVRPRLFFDLLRTLSH